MRPLTSLAFRFVAVVALGAGGLAACSCNSSDAAQQTDAGYGGHEDFCTLPVSCQEIVLACHNKDEGLGQIHECHETAHDKGTDSACKSMHDSCIATCNAAPALEGGIIEQFGPCDGGAGAHDH